MSHFKFAGVSTPGGAEPAGQHNAPTAKAIAQTSCSAESLLSGSRRGHSLCRLRNASRLLRPRNRRLRRSFRPTISGSASTRQPAARKRFNASDFLNYWCGQLFPGVASCFLQSSKFPSGEPASPPSLSIPHRQTAGAFVFRELDSSVSGHPKCTTCGHFKVHHPFGTKPALRARD